MVLEELQFSVESTLFRGKWQTDERRGNESRTDTLLFSETINMIPPSTRRSSALKMVPFGYCQQR